MSRKMILLAAGMLAFSCAATAQLTSRIIAKNAETFYSNVLTFGDSIVVGYSAGNMNGGAAAALNARTLKCDTLLFYNPDNTHIYQPAGAVYYSYNAAGLPDSVITYTPMTPAKLQVYTYNASNDVTSMTDYRDHVTVGTWSLFQQTTYTYTGSNLAAKELQQWDWSTNALEPKEKNVYTYTGSRLAADSAMGYGGGWFTWGYARYSYDASDNMDTIHYYNRRNASPYEPAATYEYVYNSNKVPVQQTIYDHQEIGNGGFFTSGTRTKYVIDATELLQSDSSLVLDTASQQFMVKNANEYHYSSVGLCDTQYTYTADQWIPGNILIKDVMHFITYNGFRQLTRKESLYRTVADTVWGHALREDQRYYYATPTGINAATVNAMDIKLYPNPAGDILNVSMGNSNKPSVISIYNATGALMRQWEEKAGNVSRSIPLQGFDSGNYILSVRSADGTRSSAQFVVQH